jgi:biopolymer transport protein ExbB/TolQ
METMYFTFGVLTMVAMLVVAAIVYSIVKIFKQEKQIKDIQKDVHWNFNDLSDRFKDVHQRIEDHYVNAKDISNAYTDMRIDKLEIKLTGQPGTKQLIKG